MVPVVPRMILGGPECRAEKRGGLPNAPKPVSQQVANTRSRTRAHTCARACADAMQPRQPQNGRVFQMQLRLPAQRSQLRFEDGFDWKTAARN